MDDALKKAVAPQALALVICDLVLRDEKSHNVSLVGLFNAILAGRFPARHDRMHVFVSLTHGHGKIPCRLECTGPDDKVIFRLDGHVEFKNPLGVIDANFELRGVVFPTPGPYVLELSCAGVPVIARRFEVLESKSQGEKGKE